MSANEASDTNAVRVQTSEESPVLHRLEVEVDAKRVKRAFDPDWRLNVGKVFPLEDTDREAA